MSQENVEVVRRVIDAFNRRDVATLQSLAAPRLEFSAGLIGTSNYHGTEGIARFIREVDTAWSALQVTLDEVKDMGEMVLTKGRFIGRGRSTGAPVERHAFYVYRVERGKIAELKTYFSEGDALEAVGLRE
jgi:ketosteroid isomerase-like protein